MSKKFLVVVDMQNDFVTGALGSEAAQSIVSNVVKAIESFNGENVVFTADTHPTDYSSDPESNIVPVPHCIQDTTGWFLVPEVSRFLSETTPLIRKSTFGIADWRKTLLIRGYHWENDLDGAAFALCGLCTDICVVSNALSLRAAFPGSEIRVVSDACAGTSTEAHEAALRVMQSVGVKVVNAEDLK